MMSWGALMMRLPKDLSMADLPRVLPADWRPPAIDSADEVRARFEELFPGQIHRDGQTCLEGEEFWIELNYRVDRKSGLVESIGVRSNAGAGAMALLKRACDAFDTRLVDCQSGEFADFSDGTMASMRQFSEWRDRNGTRSD
jgi:hypothetical protein